MGGAHRAYRSGELAEYLDLARQRTAAGEPRYASMHLDLSDERRWFEEVKAYLTRWVAAHRDGAPDTWTPDIGRTER
jgi:hypothetical protein